jgi:hypothetical protein
MIQPTPGPPFDTPPAESVRNVLLFHMSPAHVLLSSDRSTTRLPRTVLLTTLLGDPTFVMKIPTWEPLTRLF